MTARDDAIYGVNQALGIFTQRPRLHDAFGFLTHLPEFFRIGGGFADERGERVYIARWKHESVLFVNEVESGSDVIADGYRAAAEHRFIYDDSEGISNT